MSLNVLALEPFYGGSHQAFLDGWAQHSQHQFTILGLPAYKWKWRMRHAPLTFARQLQDQRYAGQRWDVLLTTDMLNLTEFIGLAPSVCRQLPSLVYFHENQLTYPVQKTEPRDLHFAFTNFTTAVAADRVVFNSDFHRTEFLDALTQLLRRMPDHSPEGEVDSIRQRSAVQPPPIELPAERQMPTNAAVLRICWTSRWEHDKNPEDFFAALRILRKEGVPFRLVILGESFRSSPAVFETARGEFAPEIEHWGYADRSEYERLLASAHVVVSTANHEFFGMGVVEAMAAGALPLLPNRLAYPEVLKRVGLPTESSADWPIALLYERTAQDLAWRLWQCSAALGSTAWQRQRTAVQQAARQYAWEHQIAAMDDLLESVAMARQQDEC